MGKGPRRRLTRPLRILLVEDNPDDVEITRRAIARALPCEIEVIGDGAAAVARLTSAANAGERGDRRRRAPVPSGRPKPDLILLDFELPAIGGLEVLRAIRGDPALDGTPVMMLTGERDDGTISDAYAWGSNSYFAKPATRAGFAETLRALALGVTDAPEGAAPPAPETSTDG